MKSITVRDIAKHCGASPTTVSRVLSGSEYPVRASVREEVLRAAKELGYSSAKRTAQSQEIAILVPTTANPFYTSVIDGVERTVTKEGISTLICNMATGVPRGKMKRQLQGLLKRDFCGVVVAASNNKPLLDEGMLEMIQRGVRVVLVDTPHPDSRYNCVSFDYRKGADIGTEYLIRYGHRNIVYAGLRLERESRFLRVDGFRNAMSRHGLEADEASLLLPGGDEFDEASQIEAGEALSQRVLNLSPIPTAVMAVNDMVAYGLLRGFSRLGLRVPEDISIMGFDDSIFSEMSSPSLTTVRVQAEQMGRMAAMLLLEDIRNEGKAAPVNLFLDPVVVERGTVATCMAQ